MIKPYIKSFGLCYISIPLIFYITDYLGHQVCGRCGYSSMLGPFQIVLYISAFAPFILLMCKNPHVQESPRWASAGASLGILHWFPLYLFLTDPVLGPGLGSKMKMVWAMNYLFPTFTLSDSGYDGTLFVIPFTILGIMGIGFARSSIKEIEISTTKESEHSSESFIRKLFPKNVFKADKAVLEYFAVKLFLVASCGPVLLLLIMFGLDVIHGLSGGGESGLGTLFGFIVLPITIIAVAIALIFAIILGLIIRTPALIILTLQALGIFIAAADMGSYMSSIFDMTSILPYIQYLVFALSSIFVFKQYLRKHKERAIDFTSSVE